MTDNPPDWARVEAVKRLNVEFGDGSFKQKWQSHHTDCVEVKALARLIAKHEQPPEDPDLATAWEVVARFYEQINAPVAAANCRDGKPPICAYTDIALAAIKLHKERNP